jgi:hypothetical protein
VPAVDVDDVKPGVARAAGGRDPVLPDAVDVDLLHCLGGDERVVVARELRGRDRRDAGIARAGVGATVRELDAR